MTDEQLIEFKNLSMQDGRLNLQWFADYEIGRAHV